VSAWLIAAVGLVYLGVAVEQGLKKDWAMAVVFSGYAFSNVGLYIMAGRG
jgi:hypothetical protein